MKLSRSLQITGKSLLCCAVSALFPHSADAQTVFKPNAKPLEAAAKPATSPSSSVTGITVDGDVSDWKGVEPVATHPATGAHPCNWRKLFLVADKNLLFVRYTTEEDIDFTKGAAYMVFLDTDQNKETGFKGDNEQFSIGADYLLQGTTLFKYTGQGTDWSWQSFGSVVSAARKNEAEFALTREQIGKPAVVNIILYGDNEAEGVGGKTLDVAPEDALTGKGKITFHLK